MNTYEDVSFNVFITYIFYPYSQFENNKTI